MLVKFKKSFTGGLIVLSAVLMNNCAGSIPVDAGWDQGIVQIDGQDANWKGLWVVPEGAGGPNYPNM